MPGLSTLSRATFSKLSGQKSSAYLLPIDDSGKPNTGVAKRFQYFPDTITDTKAVNWSAREIPGGSLPIYQWISSGERLITFTAVFSCDLDMLSPNFKEDFVASLKNLSQDDRNVDIRAAAVWLRQFMLPKYGEEGITATKVPTAKAPQRLMLVFPKSGLGASGGLQSSIQEYTMRDEVLCVMTQCDFTYEAFFPSGLPRVATAALAFAQVAQNPGIGAAEFPTSEGMGKLLDKVGDLKVGYQLNVQSKKG